MKFGTLVNNEWAGAKNPHKILLYVGETSSYVTCLSYSGEIKKFYNDKKLRLTKVGEIDLTAWKDLAKQYQ